MKNERKVIETVCQEGICPLCGSEVEYGEREDIDNGGTHHWNCPECGAYGDEGFDRVFDGNHYNVYDGDDNPVEIKTQVSTTKEDCEAVRIVLTCPVCGSSDWKPQLLGDEFGFECLSCGEFCEIEVMSAETEEK